RARSRSMAFPLLDKAAKFENDRGRAFGLVRGSTPIRLRLSACFLPGGNMPNNVENYMPNNVEINTEKLRFWEFLAELFARIFGAKNFSSPIPIMTCSVPYLVQDPSSLPAC